MYAAARIQIAASQGHAVFRVWSPIDSVELSSNLPQTDVQAICRRVQVTAFAVLLKRDGMSGLTVTAWRLSDRLGNPAQCVISERDGRWHLVVQHGRSVMIAERCSTDDAALERANEIWQVLVEQGWTEPRH
jgi:hypothetical protein